MGLGSMTGRAAGYCAGYPVPGFANPGSGGGMGQGRGLGWGRGRGAGRGMGMGRGMGWGRRAWGVAPGVPFGYSGAPDAPSPQEERAVLEDRMQALQGELDAMKKRFDELAVAEKGNPSS